MKKLLLFLSIIMLIVTSFTSCVRREQPKSDAMLQVQTEQLAIEAGKELGLPDIINFQEKKNLKWIYELCDRSDFICHAYLVNEMTGEVGQYLGQCIGYGIPYSTQYSNPYKRVQPYETSSTNSSYSSYDYNIPQAEPNQLFKPEGLSATWLIMLHPETGELTPVYIEPTIIVSPFKFG